MRRQPCPAEDIAASMRVARRVWGNDGCAHSVVRTGVLAQAEIDEDARQYRHLGCTGCKCSQHNAKATGDDMAERSA